MTSPRIGPRGAHQSRVVATALRRRSRSRWFHVDLEGPRFLSDSSGRYTIVGVLPKTFWLFYSRTDFVIPMRASAKQLNDPKQRLVATVLTRWTAHPDMLRADLAAISHRLDRESPASESQPTAIAVTSLRDWHFGDLRRPLLFLMGIAVLVVLTACANVVLVLIARTIARQRELAIRVAIGASHGRLIRQLLTESLLLSLLGGFLGLWLAVSASDVIAALVPQNVVSRIPSGLEALALDREVMLVALSASVLSGLLSGVGSLVAFRLHGSFHHVRDAALGRSSASRDILQALLVVSQTAVAVGLLVAGGLLLKSSRSLEWRRSRHPGAQRARRLAEHESVALSPGRRSRLFLRRRVRTPP